MLASNKGIVSFHCLRTARHQRVFRTKDTTVGIRLSGFMALKNGVSLGYPFVEAILSLLPACDEFVVSEGYSEDDTYAWLERLRQRHPSKIRLHRRRWPEGMTGGEAIGKVQTAARKLCRGHWAYLLQADEIMPPENTSYLRDVCRARGLGERIVGRRRFGSYRVDFVHVLDNFQRIDPSPGYRWAIRLVRNRPFVHSGGDGWQMQGLGCSLIGTAALPRPVVHVGYNFPVNTWRKHINHASLYPDHELYQERARSAQEHLARHAEGSLPLLPSASPLDLPPLIAPLVGQAEYRVREELFADE